MTDNGATEIDSEIQIEATARWYLVRTRPAGESIAQIHLERQGYRVYCPRFLRPTRVRGRWVERLASLFPRYLFLRLDVGRQTIGPVRYTVGVASIVRFGCDYAVVPDEVIENLRLRADPETGLHRLCGRLPFEPGSKVRIAAGPFDGLEGVFERESGEERVVVLLDVLGLNTHVRIPAALVLPQSESRTGPAGWQRTQHAH